MTPEPPRAGSYSADPAGRSEWKQTYSLTAANPSGDVLPVGRA
jgi:hypothetical protein